MVWSRWDFFLQRIFFLKAMTSQHYDWSVAMLSLNQHYYDDKGTTQTREYKTHCVCSVFIFLHASSRHTCWHLIINRTTEGPDGAPTLPHCWTPLWWWSGLLEASVFVPVCCHFQSCLSSAPSETPHLKDGRITPENLEVTHREKKDIHPPLTTQSLPTTQEKTAPTWSW